MPVLRRPGLCALLLLLLSACTTPAPFLGRAELPYPPEPPPVVGDIVHLATGFRVAPEQMLAIAGDSRLVYVGETHDNPAAHRLQLQVLQAVAERYPGAVALGMEMFTPKQQPILNRWSAGELDEKTFLREVDWYSTWMADFDYYRDLLLLARDQQIPVIGLNADKETKMSVSRRWEQLTDAERAALPELDQTDPYHTAMIEAVYGGHIKGEGRLAGFARVQALWDETMAENIVDFLQSPQGQGKHMVVVAGGNHVRYGFGIPRRVFRRLPLSYTLIGSKEIEIPESKRDRQMDIERPVYPMRPYDFLAYTRYEDLPGEKVKLGVRFEQNQDGPGLKILEVIDHSAADEAGLQDGDLLLRLDGEPLNDSFDLIYAISRKSTSDQVRLVIVRDEKEQAVDVTLKPLGDDHP